MTAPPPLTFTWAVLAGFLRPDWQSFPLYENGFLRCDSALSARLRERLDRRPQSGRAVLGEQEPAFRKSTRARNCTTLPRVLRLPDCRFIDLQYGDTRVEREAVQHDLGVAVDRLPDIDNFNDIEGLAALIRACDIVVTVSNTTAHLAGALGKETYLLVPSGRGRMWCWFRGRDDNPFYPRMRIRHQRRSSLGPNSSTAVATDIAAR